MRIFTVDCSMARSKHVENAPYGKREAWIEAESEEQAIEQFRETYLCFAPVYAEDEKERFDRIALTVNRFSTHAIQYQVNRHGAERLYM